MEEATFEATGEGLTFRAMDRSLVALVDLSWPSLSFERYDCSEPYKCSLRVEDLVKLVNRSEPKDSVEVSSTEEKTIMMNFVDGYRREFTIHLIESTAAPAPLPKLEYDTRLTVTKAFLEKVLGDISVVSDQITLLASETKLKFSGKSDVGNAEVTLGKNDADIRELQVSAESKATYSIDYLNSISKAAGSAAETIQLGFSSKKPIKLSFDLNSRGGKLQFFLAPRIAE